MKVLFTPITGSSIAHTARSLALADELKARGHDVYFTSCLSRNKFIENQGYKVLETYPTVNLNDSRDQSVNYLKDNREIIYKWFNAEIKAGKELKPDVVLSAPAILGPHTYYATGIPVIAIMDSQYLPESRGLMGISMANNTFKDNIITGVLRPIFESKFSKLYLHEVLEVYKQLGLKTDIHSRQEICSPMPVIIPSDDIFEPLRVPRKNTIHVGPIFWNGFEKMQSDLTDERIQEFKGDKNLIYVTFGASVFNKHIYDVVLKGILRNGYKVIVALGPNWKREEFQPDAENLLIRTLVPGMRLSKHADLIVNTGSQGAVMQGLSYGKPQVAFPTTMDQAFFANRLEELHMGVNVNKISLLKFSKRESFAEFPSEIGDKILSSIDEVIEDETFAKNAIKHKKVIESYGNPSKRAVDFIEQYLNIH